MVIKFRHLLLIINIKGVSFGDNITNKLEIVTLMNNTQEDMTLLVNHINSTARVSLHGRNPYELTRLLLHDKLFKVLKLKLIKAR